MIMTATKVRSVLSDAQPWRARAWRSPGDRPDAPANPDARRARRVAASLPAPAARCPRDCRSRLSARLACARLILHYTSPSACRVRLNNHPPV
jgi:hypothetical protein